MGLPASLTQALDKNNLFVPTPIQIQAIPLALQGKDILGSAQTGTGKTLAFAIPLVAKLLNEPNTGSALVIVPTRELAHQVTNEIRKLLFQNSALRVALLIGGEPIFRQLNQLNPSDIVKLTEKYLNRPERISVDCETTTSVKIKQEIVYASESEKYEKLVTQLCQREGSIIIFVKTKQGADQLASRLHKDDYSALAIHGDLRQHKRERVINSFRRGRNQIMVATDVASRGLDIPHIQHVINYDAPQSQADYIHRIGRTARAGAEGHALSFVTPQDKRRLPALADKQGEPNFDCSVQFKKRNSKKVFKRPSTLKTKYGRKKINAFKKKSRVLEKAY